MKDIRIACIGIGARGRELVKLILSLEENIVAVCDLYPDRAEEGAVLVENKCGKRPAVYTDYHDAISDENVNTVIIMTSWESHVEIAVAAMSAGKAVALEVGGAYSVEDCWKLVHTQEQTEAPFMFLENCCFGRRELMVLNMVEKGIFGRIVHCSGGYHHDLREEIAFGVEKRHYRLRNYLSRNCENYPTHELGPIARVLQINHGNRMLTLSSTASCAAGLHEYILANKADDIQLRNADFAQGDVVTTVIKCARGETIVLTLDTTLPRFYSRGFTVRGTKGMYEESTDSVFLDREQDRSLEWRWASERNGNATEYTAKYEHPIWKRFLEDGVRGGHGGMDCLELQAFFDALRGEKPMPIDVYDAASWMVITALSEKSVANGGEPVEIPDFTCGKWNK